MKSQLERNAEQRNSLVQTVFRKTNGVDLKYNFCSQKQGLQKNQSVKLDSISTNIAELAATAGTDIEQTGRDANINRALYWLSLKKGELGRGELDGTGILYDILGKITSDKNMVDQERRVQQAFNKAFSQDLELVYFKINVDSTGRGCVINMIVRDKITGETASSSVEATR